jgi:hypothetical protein
MTAASCEALRARALQQIEAAFAGRPAPTGMSDSKQLSDAEYDEVMSFEGMPWRDVTFDHVQRCSDAVFWFAPEAFCYYLPGLLAAGLRADRRDANAFDALIGMLDRSPEPAWWDDFFAPRWTLLSGPELDAVAAWVTWFEAAEPDAFHEGSYERARATLRLLQQRSGTP